MTRLLKVALGVLALLLLTPTIVGMIDAWCWTILGHQASSIKWSEGRAAIASSMLVLGVLSALVVLLVEKRY